MIFLFIASLLAGLLVTALFLHKRPKNSFKGKHIVVSGGSSGIGLEVAKIAAKEGAKVTIVARKEELLKTAIEQIGGESGYVSVDLAATDIATIKNKLQPSIDLRGDVDCLINCAGGAVARYFEDTSQDMYKLMMDVNFHTSVNLTQALLASLEKRCAENKTAAVVFTSSVAGLMGIFGYSAYSSSKFALMGLAQTLRSEKRHLGLNVMVAFPPDTETPGYKNENIGKPAETVAISEMGGLQKPASVARKILDDIYNRRFTSSFGLDGQFLCLAASGLWPIESFTKVIAEILMVVPGRILGAYLHYAFTECAALVRATRRGQQQN